MDEIELRHPETNELIGLIKDGIEYRMVNGELVPLDQLEKKDGPEEEGENNGKK